MVIRVGVVLGSKPGSFSKEPHYSMEIRYFTALEKAGMLAVPITYSNIEEQLENVDAILLPGGDFKTPDCYYSKKQGSPYLDEGIWFDAYMAIGNYALENNIPLLGICAGMQTIAVLLGCKLSMGLESHRLEQNNILAHSIKIQEDSLLFDIFNSKEIKVNSIHREYVSKTSDKIKVSAVSEDGIIEAVESNNHKFALGVQWHPECLLDIEENEQLKIFKYLKSYCLNNK